MVQENTPPESPEHSENSAGLGKPENRRGFFYRIGKAVFSLSIIGAFGGAGNKSARASQTGGGGIKHDKECGATHINPHGTIEIEPDEACKPPPNYQKDENCGDGEPDNSCFIRSEKGNSGKDPDENCGEKLKDGSTDPDESCGDCDDNHESDENCGNIKKDGTRDRDELCGHVSFFGNAHQDQCCGKKSGEGTEADEGCGYHDTLYNNEKDTDNNCNQTLPNGTKDVDNNCASKASDETCGSNPPAFSSDPDEKCSKTDEDQGCGQGGTDGYNGAYDVDKSCGSSTVPGKDEACGSSAGIYHDYDQNCSKTDTDEGCRQWWWEPDQSD